MYKNRNNLIFGFHGCDRSLCDSLVNNKRKKLDYSENNYDWLGKGMYFWENDPKRAFDWAIMLQKRVQNAKQKIKNPAVLGAVICLGNCLDFTEQENLLKIKKHYEELKKEAEEKGIELPKNSGGKDLYKRELDCLVINSYIKIQKDSGNEYDSVRGVFFEGNELYPSAGFREKDHIQIAIINPNCIKAFFKERISDSKFKSV